MKKVLYYLLLLCFVHTSVSAQKITSFLSQSGTVSLSAFMDLVGLKGDERHTFEAFYKKTITDLHQLRSQNRKQQQLQKLEQQGMNSLEIKQPRWAREIGVLLDKDHPLYNNAHAFVVRFGALESYYEQKARAKNNTWAKVRGFFSQTKDNLASWFSSLRPKRTVA